ncbi:glycosyltransferase family 2 protein [Marivita sp. GX14005]|uniref:glycosyltransferase n=1 Tax=Marivita sp. GX14005 TaxID=2942276 RepID=UPI002019CF3E|nr:glycosyltransferase family 2 protein [Marivita sp. GX14005]MCL3881773.1 glycosyltransferase [Marivita sp. GX14005]
MSVDVVLIGRNEGARLVASLASVMPQARRVVYVDSGSTDNSVEAARTAGAEVVALDMTVPFTAARARNEGYAALGRHGDRAEMVQFLDGDCIMAPDWLRQAEAAMRDDDGLGLVTGQQAELHRNTTVYSQMSDFEWKRPVGEIETCGGNMMLRAAAFDAVGGFDPQVIAAEDDEICNRLRKAGWRLVRITAPMAQHDGNAFRFSQWWKRAERTGHGFAQVGALHPEYFRRERLRGWLFGLILPITAVLGTFVSLWLPLLVLAIYLLSYLKAALGLRREGLPPREAMHHAVFLTLSKFPNVIGMIRYHWRRLRHAQMEIIEYK